MVRLTFNGAARQVTGSMHILEANGKIIVLDCGMFQGRRALSRELNCCFPINPRDIHAVILSHAHIDHSGRLPLLVRQDFGGVIHATSATRDLCTIMLADAAFIQSEDARFVNKRRSMANEPPVEPLYTAADAERSVQLMRTHPLRDWFDVGPGVRARFFEAGHMLGSAGIEVEAKDAQGRRTRVVFTGDVGRWGIPLINDPAPLPPCDYLICESTYGGRNTDPIAELPNKLADVVKRTVGRNGRVIIPAFSVGRTQTIIYSLRQLFASGDLPPVPVFVDSPLAVNATEVFGRHPECYDAKARQFVHEMGDLLDGPGIHFVREREDSKRLMRRKGPCIVISASGMCESGRILHHLRHGIIHPNNTVLIVGFQAEHTLGRRIVERQEIVRVFGEPLPLRSEVVVLNGFSSHADARELKKHTDPLIGRCKQTFLVHGEMDQALALANTMRRDGHGRVEIPATNDSFVLE